MMNIKLNINTNKLDFSKLIKTYPEHEWIDLTEFPEYPIDDDTTPVDLNLQCKSIIKEWLETNRGLSSVEDFPYSGEPQHDRLVSQLVNGFCVKIDNGEGVISKVVFIPSEQIDISSFEVAQEWVDLTNWMGDYYVPIQVDVDAQYLHLWGMITHQELKQIEEPDDEMFRYYNVDGDRTIDNLEVLWTSCELEPEPRSNNIPTLVTQEIGSLIKRVKLEAGSNFDRLILQFNEWGAILNDSRWLAILNDPQWLAILNDPQWLAMYLPASVVPSKVENVISWFNGIKDKYICFKDFPAHLRLELQPGFMGLLEEPQYRFLGSETPASIKNEHQDKKTQDLVKILSEKNTVKKRQQLVNLMRDNKNSKLRWEAAGYLWSLEADNEFCHRRFRELELSIPGHKLFLMVAVILLVDNKYAFLVNVYNYGDRQYLPSPLKLTLLSENDELIDECDNQGRDRERYIQLSFTDTLASGFKIRVSVDDDIVTESFKIA
jgi:hypothetical protein